MTDKDILIQQLFEQIRLLQAENAMLREKLLGLKRTPLILPNRLHLASSIRSLQTTKRKNEKLAAKSGIQNITGLFSKLMKSTERSSIKYQLKKYAVVV